MKVTKQEQLAALKELQELIKPGDTIYTILRHVSNSGMLRVIDIQIIKDNQPIWLSYKIAQACGETLDNKREGLRITGCGMDMGYHIVSNLGYSLFKDGFYCIGDKEGKRCPSNDHFNGDRNYNKHLHISGGYALRHQWL